ncbi:DUF3558 domain-containing protein [Nocardia terpenica]|uniref:DUF3558 domain-containing protein n=1 Tax=Nocardia terpenica TaxID=455432 RepID=UPI002FDFB6DF
MASWGTAARVATFVAGAALLGSGCSSSTGGPQPSGNSGGASSTSIAVDVPKGYDPCEDVPQSVLDSEGLHSKLPEHSSADGGIKWQGCGWVKSDGYSASIRTTNLTVDMVRDKHFADTQEYAIAGRRAISTRQVEEHPDAVCTIDVEMKGGSLEFFLSNPPSNRITGSTDTCQLARTLAEKVVPTMPAGV